MGAPVALVAETLEEGYGASKTGSEGEPKKRRAVEQRVATDEGHEVCPLSRPLMGAVVEGGLRS